MKTALALCERGFQEENLRSLNCGFCLVWSFGSWSKRCADVSMESHPSLSRLATRLALFKLCVLLLCSFGSSFIDWHDCTTNNRLVPSPKQPLEEAAKTLTMSQTRTIQETTRIIFVESCTRMLASRTAWNVLDSSIRLYKRRDRQWQRRASKAIVSDKCIQPESVSKESSHNLFEK